jgi:iron(III) transport system ATP-binding protein
MALLEVNNTSKLEREKYVVNNITFSQPSLQKTAIAGATGSGKTTLLKMIAGFIQPDAGEILFDNKRVLGPWEQLIPGHPKIAYLSQHFELLNNYKVAVLLERSNQLSNSKASEIYSICRIEHLLQRKTNELSGGEKQRIALALQLIKIPQLLILDEPFSNLDFIHKNTIKKVIEDAYLELNLSCIMVSHDAQDILSWADTILIMQDGNIIQQGTSKEVYYQPINEYCAGLMGAYNLVDANTLSSIINNKDFKLTGKNAFVRPEQFVIEPYTDNGFKAIVKNILFFGSYYTIDVAANHQQLSIRAHHCSYSIGDTIYLSLSTNDICFI